MSVLDELVTNRTAADVSWIAQMSQKGLAGRTAAENFQWMRGHATEVLITSDGYTVCVSDQGELILRGGFLRGAYNYADLNRVERAVREAYTKVIALYDTTPPSMPVIKTNWTQADVPSLADATRYLGNIIALKNLLESNNIHDFDPRGYFDAAWTAIPTDLQHLTYAGANQIEQLLGELYRGALWLEAVLVYGGTPRTWAQVEAAYPTWGDIEGTKWPFVTYGEGYIEDIPRPW